MSFTVAIDGPAAAGKGTIARVVAGHFGFEYLDTGLLYRAVGRAVLDGVEAEAAARALRPEDLARDGLRTSEVGAAASKAAARPEVREALLDFQRAFARRSGGAVLDGRDIGTVICPEADVKLYVTASDEVRAGRRWKELRDAGEDVTPDEVLENLHIRDGRDSQRAAAPLRPAEDAVVLDTTSMSIEAAIDAAMDAVEAARARAAAP
ncbi:MAG: d(CMP) kinase [Pseudomonadota bacterium]